MKTRDGQALKRAAVATEGGAWAEMLNSRNGASLANLSSMRHRLRIKASCHCVAAVRGTNGNCEASWDKWKQL